MLNVGAELAAAIEAPERTVRPRVSVDWDADGHGPAGSIDDLSGKVASVAVMSVLQGTQPDQAAVVEGTAAATFVADLAAGDTDDERLTAVRYFSPHSALSPLQGKERLGRDVEIDVEFLTSAGWQGAPLLRGTTRALPTAVARQSALLAGIDYRTRLRTSVTLPVVIAEAPDYVAATTLYPVKPGLEGPWVVSYVLWQCGLPLSPPPGAGCRWWVPMHGSLQPFIGGAFIGSPSSALWEDQFTDVSESRPPAFVPGPFVLACEAALTPVQVHISAETMATGSPMFAADGRSSGRFEMRIKAASTANFSAVVVSNASTTTSSVAWVAATGSSATLAIRNDAITRNVIGPTLPVDGQWHRVGVHWDDAAGSATFIIDAATTVVTFTPTPATAANADVPVVTFFANAETAEVQVTTGITVTDPWMPLTWDSGCDVDRSQIRLDGIVGQAAAEGWQILQQMAAAEQGAVYLQPGGRLRYATRARLVGPASQVPQRTITAAADILELAEDYRLDSVFNVLMCPYQPVTMSRQVVAWTLGETVVIPRGNSVTIEATFSGLGTEFTTLAGTANTRADGAGTSYTLSSSGSVTAVLAMTSPTSATITVTNYAASTVWLVNASGQPNVTITGDVISQGEGATPPQVTDEVSRARYGDQPLPLPGSQWIQRRSHAYGLAMITAGDLAYPSPVLTDLEIPGDPRLEPFDRVTISDPDNTGLGADYWYVGGRHDLSEGEYRQSIAARPARTRFLAGTGLVGIDLVG
jgi:hypothetical protein